jgi:UDP-glucuronate 4-epimerase
VSILAGEEIELFGDGSSARDYTFVGDIVAGIMSALEYRVDGYEVFNLGNSRPVKLRELVAAIETAVGKKAAVRRLGDQPGDVPITYADISRSRAKLGYNPATPLAEGMQQFVAWLKTGG